MRRYPTAILSLWLTQAPILDAMANRRKQEMEGAKARVGENLDYFVNQVVLAMNLMTDLRNLDVLPNGMDTPDRNAVMKHFYSFCTNLNMEAHYVLENGLFLQYHFDDFPYISYREQGESGYRMDVNTTTAIPNKAAV